MKRGKTAMKKRVGKIKDKNINVMSLFCFKKLEKPVRTGEKLKKRRKEKKLSLEEAENLTHIPKKYLRAIEKARFKELPPAKAHCVAYIKKYATVLGLNPDSLLYQFSSEAELENYTPTHPHRHLKIRPYNSIIFWVKKLLIILLLLSFVGYLVWQINGILQPPKLTVFTPIEGYVSNKLTALVQGETEKETRLTINGKEIRPNDRGQFETNIDLSKGINTITIISVKKHGKTTTIIRHVIMK